jgi:hypothetical protein
MPESNQPKQPKEKIVSTTAQSMPAFTPQAQRTLISVAATAVILSFILPWVNILGSNISGMDIQKNFPSYRLVWLVPVSAIITLLLNFAGQNINLLRRLAGLCPFVILAYALNQTGSDLLKIISVGGWLALIGGGALICIPNVRKPTNPS